MNVLAVIFRKSQQIGLWPTVLCAAAWLVFGAVGATALAVALAEHPTVATVVTLLVVIVVALGGLVAYWLIADHVDFRRRGYHVRWLSGTEWLYEEIISDRGVRSLPCGRTVRGIGYPAPSEIRIPSEARWETEVPSWAHGRRAEVAQRIATCFGAEQGGDVQFADE